MTIHDIRQLFDYLYWANGRILDATGTLGDAEFVDSTGETVRDLRTTLVHQLDVEWSWRLKLQGRIAEVTVDLHPADFPDLATLRTRWQQDEAEMRNWLSVLKDEDLAMIPETGDVRDVFPLWHFLVHVQMHSAQSRADAATILTNLGASPGDYDFLDFLDTTWEHPGG
jgi:uncharacterized damage-inducible protein DinB